MGFSLRAAGLKVPRLSMGLMVLLMLASVGCRSNTPHLTFRSLDNSAKLEQPFALAAMSRDPAGDYDLVLVSQGLEDRRSFARWAVDSANPVNWFRMPKPGAALEPVEAAPVRQVVHMKIHWRPRAGTTPENPAASNATVRWVVFGTPEPTEQSADILEFQGTAFVRVRFVRGGYDLRIRAGDLRPTRRDGEMVDVIGPNTLEGRARVNDDAFTVANVLAELPPATELAPPRPGNQVRPATRPVSPRHR